MQLSHFWPFLKFALVPLLAGVGFWCAARIQLVWLRFGVRFVSCFVCVVSATALVSTLPAGSIDISELWGFLLIDSMVAIPVLVLVLSRHILSVWLRRTVRAVSSLLVIPASGFVFLACLVQASCTENRPAIYSPDGGHVALLNFYEQGALGADTAVVRVRRSWSPIATKVFSGDGQAAKQSIDDSPQVFWLDSSTLVIRFWGGIQRKQVECTPQATGVTIVCESRVSSALHPKPKSANLIDEQGNDAIPFLIGLPFGRMIDSRFPD
jgi:hypothetical protein